MSFELLSVFFILSSSLSYGHPLFSTPCIGVLLLGPNAVENYYVLCKTTRPPRPVYLVFYVGSNFGSEKFQFFCILYVFLTSPALPGVPVVWFHVRQTYSLSSLALKRVTCRSTINTHFPPPCYPRYL